MIGEAVFYAASRATHSAIENVSRRLTWGAIGAAFLLAAMVLALIAAYMVAEPKLGALRAVALLAAACAAVGIVSLSVPWIIDKVEGWRSAQASPVATAVAAVDEETKEAVDHFGALQLVGTAFLFGLGAARRLRR